MTPLPLPPLRLTGGLALRDGALQARSVALAGGRFVRAPLPEVAVPGCLILPGIVDLHGGAVEGAAAAGVDDGMGRAGLVVGRGRGGAGAGGGSGCGACPCGDRTAACDPGGDASGR